MYPILPAPAPNALESIACPTANVPVGVFVTVSTTVFTDAVVGYVPFTLVTPAPGTVNAEKVVVMSALLNVPLTVYAAEPDTGTVVDTGNETIVGDTYVDVKEPFAIGNDVLAVVTDAPFERP
jgi:hypothetical protein